MKRRDLIKNGTLAGAAILFPASGAFGAVSDAGALQAVMKALAAYSGRVLPKVNGTNVHLLASIDKVEAFVDGGALHKALPDEHIIAEGNTLSFIHGGTSYRIENVLPEHFDSRARTLG